MKRLLIICFILSTIASCAVIGFQRQYEFSAVTEHYNIKPVSAKRQANVNAKLYSKMLHVIGYADTSDNVIIRNFKLGKKVETVAYKNGRIVYFISYNLDTIIYREYAYPNGELKEERLTIGKYTLDRIVKDTVTTTYLNYRGIEIGPIKVYHNNILHSSFQYTDTTYEATKELKYRGDGIIYYGYHTPYTGIHTYYYPNGKVEHIEYWKNFEKDSVWTYFDTIGKVVKSESMKTP